LQAEFPSHPSTATGHNCYLPFKAIHLPLSSILP
jgi:hypothetical protein